MDNPVTFQNSKGYKLAGLLRTTNDTEHILIIEHGFHSSKNSPRLVKLSDELERNNLASLRFDMYGHGDSDGKFEDITLTEALDDALCAIKYIKSLGYASIGLLGSSFGGAASILAASKSADLKFLCLKSPASDCITLEKVTRTKEEMDRWQRSRFIEYEGSHSTDRLNYTFYEDLFNYDIYAAAKNIVIPTLIVHGDTDEEVPYAQSQKLVTCIPNANLINIPGADHRYTNETLAGQMLQAFQDFTLSNFSKRR